MPGFSSCGFVERMLGQLAAECPSLAIATVLLGIITNGVTRHKSKSHLQDSQKPHLLGRCKSPIDLLVPNQELILDEVCQLTGQQIINKSSSEPEPESGTTWGPKHYHSILRDCFPKLQFDSNHLIVLAFLQLVCLAQPWTWAAVSTWSQKIWVQVLALTRTNNDLGQNTSHS